MKKLFAFFILLLQLSLVYSQDDYVSVEPINEDNTPYQEFPNTDYTNYTVSSSAFTLKKYDAQVLGTDIIFGKMSYGIGERTTGSLNLSMIGTFIISVKHRFPISEDVNFALSACGGNFFLLNKDSIIRFTGGQSVITFGDHQNHLSIGAGLYFGKSTFEVLDNTHDLYFHNVFAAIHRQIKRKTYIVAEGMYLWNYNTFMGSVCVKFLIKRKMSLHIGLMPLYRNGRIRQNQNQTEGGLVPVISYRWLFAG